MVGDADQRMGTEVGGAAAGIVERRGLYQQPPHPHPPPLSSKFLKEEEDKDEDMGKVWLVGRGGEGLYMEIGMTVNRNTFRSTRTVTMPP